MGAGYWERCWKEENPRELHRYLGMYRGVQLREIDIFRAHGVVNVCDAACGFGAYFLAFSSNGFSVEGFDISKTAVELARAGLRAYGVPDPRIKVASIFDTGYPDDNFDGVVAHAVLDHMRRENAVNALKELFRITKKRGLLLISFDCAGDEDFSEKHIVLRDGTMVYVSGAKKDMMFRPYSREDIGKLLSGYNVIYETENKRERVFILQK